MNKKLSGTIVNIFADFKPISTFRVTPDMLAYQGSRALVDHQAVTAAPDFMDGREYQ